LEFSGFTNSDFDFFKKKSTMIKAELDTRREDVKKHFREFCYEIQKCYYRSTNSTLILDKDFQGLNKNINFISAKSKIEGIEYLDLSISLYQDSIQINLICPPDGDYKKYEYLKGVMQSSKEVFVKFFKENKSMYVTLFKRINKKGSEYLWQEEYRFINNELSLGEYDSLIDNMERLQPYQYDSKKIAGIHIGSQFLKAESTKLSKSLAPRVCSEIVKLIDLCKSVV